MADVPQPDPASGVFATMLVVEGVPLELDAQLERLSASVELLYGARLPASARALAAARARAHRLGRLRLSAMPTAAEAIQLDAVARAVERASVLPDWARALVLRSAVADDWQGAHKWADRRWLDQLDARAAPAAALLVSRERGVLETTRANVFAVGSDGVLRTPPLDGRILPGITRARVIALARQAGVAVREERLMPDDLHAARELFATGSIRGVEPVRSFDDTAFDGPGDLTLDMTQALRRHWLGQRAGSVA